MSSGDGDSSEYIFPSEDDDSLHGCTQDVLRTSLMNTTILCSSGQHWTAWLLAPNVFTRWTPLYHVFFQLANFFLFLYFAFFMSPRNAVMGRFLGLLYAIFMMLWAYFVMHSMDTLAWNAALAIVNVAALFLRLVSALCGPGSACRRGFGRDVEQVYKKLFEPLQVTRRQFARVLSCKRNTRQLHPGENYASEKLTRVDSLALLLSGRLLVSQQGRPLHVILPHQFIDSPEYFGVSTDELFQVTITAVEDSKILVWHRDKLRLTIMSDEFLRVMFDHVIGRDVVRKLIQVSDSVTVPNGYYNMSSSPKDIISQHPKEAMANYNNQQENEPMLIQATENGSFETNEIWSLTKIAEEETSV